MPNLLDSDYPAYDPEYRDEECEYCWQQARWQRLDDGGDRYVYCDGHAPAGAVPNREDDARVDSD